MERELTCRGFLGLGTPCRKKLNATYCPCRLCQESCAASLSGLGHCSLWCWTSGLGITGQHPRHRPADGGLWIACCGVGIHTQSEMASAPNFPGTLECGERCRLLQHCLNGGDRSHSLQPEPRILGSGAETHLITVYKIQIPSRAWASVHRYHSDPMFKAQPSLFAVTPRGIHTGFLS